MENKTFDFSGWATRFNVKCSDGRTIRKGAFKDCDGKTVPLVWNHNHNDVDNVLGHALLQNREEGMYAYCSFNETEQGKTAKELVKHGDIVALSIYANQLKQNGGDVLHGAIRELSLVLAGANPKAVIENVMAHSEVHRPEEDVFIPEEGHKETWNLEAKFEEVVVHSEPENNPEDISHAENEKEPAAADKGEDEETIADVYNTLTEKQKLVVEAIIGAALSESNADNNQEEEKDMKHNAFDQTNMIDDNTVVLSHSDLLDVVKAAKQNGSMRDAYEAKVAELAAAQGVKGDDLAHSVTNLDVLFPEVQAIGTPSTINDDTTWVGKVMGAVHHTPFSRVKMMAFDITGEEARARGYIKGQQKEEEVIAALRRETSPQTVYKLQKLDRDDIIDVTDFDIVAYLKTEMRGKLNEEIARAILIGDGRSAASKDKIDPLHIRPILGDNPTYVVAKYMTREQGEDDYKFAKRFIKDVIRSRKDYKGKGNPTLYTTEDLLTDMLLIEDRNERVIYDTMDKLKTALRVSDIVTVPCFENQTRTADGFDYKLMGIIVNLGDYNVGADKGGAVAMFDDFDINFNKYEYLIETRISGAMVAPKGAITFEEKTTHVVAPEGEE